MCGHTTDWAPVFIDSGVANVAMGVSHHNQLIVNIGVTGLVTVFRHQLSLNTAFSAFKIK